MFKYTEICHKMRKCLVFIKKKEERKGLNYNTLCKSFPLRYFSLNQLELVVVFVFEQVRCSHGLHL